MTNFPPRELLPGIMVLVPLRIQNAYDQIVSEGYIYTVPKNGYYVRGTGNDAVPKETNLSLNIQRQEKKVEYAVDPVG